MDRVEATERLWNRAQSVLASGTWSVTNGAFRYPDGLFPVMAESGRGCRLVDTTGREYIDWLMAWGTTILGYRHPAVEAAAIDQLRRSGPLLSLLHPVEVDAARLVRELVPCAEAVAFAKNGSDGLGVAVRIARAATGRDGVLVCGYHGFHDWYVAVHPWVDGVPDSIRSIVRSFPYNDLDAVRRIFARHGDRIAAVVLEATSTELPAPGFLEGLRELTLDHGALLVFDEVITAFRVARGGAQEAFGVVPDLACLGKAMANGFALSALVGKRDVLAPISRVGHGTTFRGETTALAAARACLTVIRDEPVCEHVAAVGATVRAGFEGAARDAGVDARLVGPDARMSMTFAPVDGVTPIEQQALVAQECLRRGVLMSGIVLPSYAHDDAAVEATIAALREALGAVALAVRRGSAAGLLHHPARQIHGGAQEGTR